MALLTFNPTPPPSPGTRVEPTFSLNATTFGDGYTQESPQGINHIRDTLTLRWEALTAEQADAIYTFLINRKGTTPFWYQPLGYAAPVKWTCKRVSIVRGAPCEIDATLTQSFSLLT